MRREVPSFNWDKNVPAETVSTLVDLADACNDAEFSYAEARLIEARLQTLLESHGRDYAPTPRHRAWTAERAYSTTVDYTEDTLRLYLTAAARFAVAAARQLQAQMAGAQLPEIDVEGVRGSQVYADPELIPLLAPAEPMRRRELGEAHSKIVTTVRMVETDAGSVAELCLDPEDMHRPVAFSILEYGAFDLADALHDYANTCLWTLALG